MRPSSLGGGRILRRTLSVRLSVRPSVRPVIVFVYFFTVEPSYERTSKIEKLLFSLMGQRCVCTFRHAQRAAYRTAISAAQTCFNQYACCLHLHSTLLFRLDALALSIIATATWLAGWLGGWLAGWLAGCHTPVLYQNG